MALWPNGLTTEPTRSSPWGYSAGYGKDFHWGGDWKDFDLNCAIGDGVVIEIGYNTFGGGGREVYVRLDSGDVALYCHNEDYVPVRVGQRVVEGQPVGIQGSTGRSTGKHLHLEIWLGGDRNRRVDPRAYILARLSTKPAGGGGTIITEQDEDMELIYIRAANGTAVDAGVKGVIGDINLKFYTPEERTHFLNLWGTPEKPRNSRVHISYHNVQVGDVQTVLNMFATATSAQVSHLTAILGTLPVGSGAPLDLQAIAKAVNDDAAQRLLD